MTDLCAAARAVEQHDVLRDALSDLVHAAAAALPGITDPDTAAALRRTMEGAYAALAPSRGQRDAVIDRAGDAAAIYAAEHGVSFERALVACSMD